MGNCLGALDSYGTSSSKRKGTNSASKPQPSPQPQQQKQVQPPGQNPVQERVKPPQAYGASAYEMVRELGTGGGTLMRLMKNKKTKEFVAVKFVERDGTGGLSKNTEREIVNHRRLLHPNIIRFNEVFVTEDHLAIVMEFASGGTLRQRVEQKGPFKEEAARQLYLQLLAGMKYCHDRGVFHRDLRLENIHLHGGHYEPQLKITGFGYSKSAFLDSPTKTNVGNPLYTPPELLMATRNENSAYDGSSNDMWSSGIILFYTLVGLLPFEDLSTPGALSRETMRNIVNVQYSFPANLSLSPECKDFIGKIFVKEPSARMNVAQAYLHPWLTGTKLPTSNEVVEQSTQTESEIHDIVEKARRRREKRLEGRTSQRPHANGLSVKIPSREEGLNGRSLMDEQGIAEVSRLRKSTSRM